VDPAWESRSDWEIYKGSPEVSEIAPGVLGVEQDLVLVPPCTTPRRTGQPVRRGRLEEGRVRAIPGKTMPSMTVVERDYPNLYRKFTSLGPLLDKLGNGGKGISWNTEARGRVPRQAQPHRAREGVSQGRPAIDRHRRGRGDPDLAPETNGHVAVKAWEALGKITGRDHTHLAVGKEHEKIRFRDVRRSRARSSPRRPGRAWKARSQLQRRLHQRARADPMAHPDRPPAVLPGPPVDARLRRGLRATAAGRHRTVSRCWASARTAKEIVLNFITPHQKWGIHSTYSDNLRMLTLSRGGPIVWISEDDARRPASSTTTGSSVQRQRRDRRARWSASA
jgi:nitrate reductase alpha subunit